MKTSKLQKGFTIIEIAIVIVVIALASGSAWYVGKHNKSAKSSASSSSKTTSATTKSTATSSTTSNLTTYENKDLGFKFSYPTSYGTATLTTNADSNGAHEYSIGFANRTTDNNNTVSIKMENPNFERGGIGSVCNLGVSLPKASYVAQTPLTGSWVSSRTIVSETGLSGIESVSFPDDTTTGDASSYCPDVEISLLKQISNANFNVALVFFANRSPEAGKLNSQAEYNSLYATSPNSFVSATQRDELIAIAKSFTNL